MTSRSEAPRRRTRAATRANTQSKAAQLVAAERSLLDLVDNLLNRGVVIKGDAVLGVANVDLIYLQLSALLCAADRVDVRLLR